jgi:hypothetical protein
MRKARRNEDATQNQSGKAKDTKCEKGILCSCPGALSTA